jgi:Zn-dependent peptidase ImmA (M78 family)
MLAARASIAVVTLSRITNGKQSPDDETVERLVAALEYPRDFFFGEEIDPIDSSAASFRSLKAMTARERDAATAAGSLAFLLNDWVKAEFNLPQTDLLDLHHEANPAAAARTMRQHWAIGEKPMGNIIKFLESKGVRVFSLAENTRNVDAFSCWRNDEPYIFLNTFKTTERSRFDAAHELGHLLLHKHGGPKQGRNSETEANAFASAFLMPPDDVTATIPYVAGLKGIIDAKSRWGVSAMALSYTLHKMDIITDWQYRSLCIQINRTYGTEEPNGLPPERSSVWQSVLTDLWRDGVSRNHIAERLYIPHDEMENLLFGLAGAMEPPPRQSGPPTLKMV